MASVCKVSNNVLLCEGVHRGEGVWESKVPRREEGGGLGKENYILDLASPGTSRTPDLFLGS